MSTPIPLDAPCRVCGFTYGSHSHKDVCPDVEFDVRSPRVFYRSVEWQNTTYQRGYTREELACQIVQHFMENAVFKVEYAASKLNDEQKALVREIWQENVPMQEVRL